MTNTNSALQMALDLIHKGFNKSYTLQTLTNNGFNKSDAELFTSQAYKAHHLRRRKSGILLGLMGCVLLFTGFFLTIFIFHVNQSIDTTLYGMNSAGVLLLLMGMTNLMGR
jgi:hypothetical protein